MSDVFTQKLNISLHMNLFTLTCEKKNYLNKDTRRLLQSINCEAKIASSTRPLERF